MLIAILDLSLYYPVSGYIPYSFVQPRLNGQRRYVHGHLKFTSSIVQPWLNEWRKKQETGILITQLAKRNCYHGKEKWLLREGTIATTRGSKKAVGHLSKIGSVSC